MKAFKKEKTMGEKSLLAFIVSKSSTKHLIKANNSTLAERLIPKGYPRREKSKVSDESFNLPCRLNSLKIDNLLND